MSEATFINDDSGKAFLTNPAELKEFIQVDDSHLLELENWE